MKKLSGWDYWGVLVSGLCVIHCLAVPIVILLFPALGLSMFPQEDMTHAVLLAFILGVAGIAFFTGYRVHGNWRPVAWLVAGLILVIFATFFVHKHFGHQFEPLFAIAGSLCLIRAHYLNHKCKKCEHEHAHHEKNI
jgi:MerC mercury resistance protein